MAGDPGRDDSHEGNPSTIMQIQASADGLDGGATKVDIAVSDGAFTWSQGDDIAVYSTEDGYVEFSLKRGAGTASGTFAQEFSGTRANYAVYPASVRDDNHYTSGQHSTVFVEGASNKCLRSTVNSVYGVVVKPTSGTISLKRTYTLAEWKLAELEGYVFLPAAGYRSGGSIKEAGSSGDYWSSSSGTHDRFAFELSFEIMFFNVYDLFGRAFGCCVRPVHNK